MKYNKISGFLILVFWIIFVIVAAILESCHTERTAYIPEFHDKLSLQHDTLIRIDTFDRELKIIVREVDSTKMAEYGIRMASAERAWLVEAQELRRKISELRERKTDTFIQHDSIPYPVEVPVVKEVEKPPSRWRRFQQRIGGAVILLLGLSLGGGILYILFKHRIRL